MTEARKVETVIYLVCTDRGQHRKRRIDRVAWWTGGARQIGALIMDTPHRPTPVLGDMGRVITDAGGHSVPPIADAATSSGLSRNSYQPRCASPSCRSNPQISIERWWSILEEAKRVGLPEVDVSRLD